MKYRKDHRNRTYYRLLRVVAFAFVLGFLSLVGANAQSAKKIEHKADINFEEGNYVLALKQYLSLYQDDKMNMKYNRRIGQCFLYTNIDKSRARPFLQYAAAQPDADAEVFFELGEAFMHSTIHGPYWNLAKLNFNRYKEMKKRDDDAIKRADRHIKMCERIKQMTEPSQKKNVSFVNLGEAINTPADESHPFISSDESFMAFNSDRQFYTSNIFMASYNKEEGQWKTAEKGNSSINTITDDLLAGMSPSGKPLLVHNANKKLNRNLYHTVSGRMGFEGLRKYSTVINDEEGLQAGADITMSGDTLFFASDREGGYGGYDLYVCVKMPDDTWSMPQNLGGLINTPYDDNYPNYIKDLDVLYFSSKGHNTMGGYDLFKAKHLAEFSNWSEPENLGFPINDTYDNKTISFAKNFRYAYVSAWKKDTKGGLDIYKVYFNDVAPNIVLLSGNIMVGDSTENKPIEKVGTDISIVVRHGGNNKIYGRYTLNDEGRFIIAIAPGKYVLEVKGKQYKPHRQNFEIEDIYTQGRQEKEISVLLELGDGNS